jgi:hypothetical protein
VAVLVCWCLGVLYKPLIQTLAVVDLLDGTLILINEARGGDHKGRSTLQIAALGSWGQLAPVAILILVSTLILIHTLILNHKAREGDPKGWSTVLVTALGSVLGGNRSPAAI